MVGVQICLVSYRLLASHSVAASDACVGLRCWAQPARCTCACLLRASEVVCLRVCCQMTRATVLGTSWTWHALGAWMACCSTCLLSRIAREVAETRCRAHYVALAVATIASCMRSHCDMRTLYTVIADTVRNDQCVASAKVWATYWSVAGPRRPSRTLIPNSLNS